MRIFVGMLGYNRPDVIEGGLKNFEETVDPDHHIIKTLFSCGYPLPNAQENRIKERELAAKYGWWNPTIENKGVMQNWNTAIHDHFQMHPGDFLFTFDPDVRMERKGWLPAMVEALQSDEKAMFCSSALNFHHHDWMQTPPYNRKVTTLPSGLRISRFDCLIAWASGMWKADFLITRPRDFGMKGCYYGESEASDHKRLIEHGYTWLSVTDFVDNHLGAPDQEYLDWKLASAHGTTNKPFDVWLKEKK